MMRTSARFSPCGAYRYHLTRRWAEGEMLTFVMLNPSTADADLDDPTIRRCIGFARREGAAGLQVVNLFAYRATKPKDLWAARAVQNIVGPENERVLEDAAASANSFPLVCAWGAAAGDRATFFLAWMRARPTRLACLGLTLGGHPVHVLRRHGGVVDDHAGRLGGRAATGGRQARQSRDVVEEPEETCTHRVPAMALEGTRSRHDRPNQNLVLRGQRQRVNRSCS